MLMHTLFRPFLFLALLLSSATLLPAKEPLKGPEAKQFTLANGMRFILIEDPQSTATIHSVWYKVGSADEPKGKSGLAHFLEHLMYKGTAKHGLTAYADLVSADGAYYNALTSYDYTLYHVRVPKRLLSQVMELEADRMRGLRIQDQLLETERLVIKEERRLRVDGNPESILREQMEAVQFKDHPYGVLVAGLMQDIDKLKPADVQAFYDTYYHPDNATVVVAGNVQLQELRDLAEEYFASIPSGKVPARDKAAALPANPATHHINMKSPAARQSIVLQSYSVPSYGAATNRDGFALDFLAVTLASGTQGRLVKSLVLGTRQAIDVDVYYDGYRRLGGQFILRAMLNRDVNPADVEKAFLAALQDIRENGITQQELDTAYKRARISEIYRWDSQSSLFSDVGGKAILGWDLSRALSLENWEGVTPQQVKAAAEKYLTPERAMTGVLQPVTGN